MRHWCKAFAFLALCAPLIAQPRTPIVVKAARLIDGRGGLPLEPVMVRISNDRIVEVGSVAAGKFADLIAVVVNPLVDIGGLRNVGFVMKGGAVYKDELSGRRANHSPRRDSPFASRGLRMVNRARWR